MVRKLPSNLKGSATAQEVWEVKLAKCCRAGQVVRAPGGTKFLAGGAYGSRLDGSSAWDPCRLVDPQIQCFFSSTNKSTIVNISHPLHSSITRYSRSLRDRHPNSSSNRQPVGGIDLESGFAVRFALLEIGFCYLLARISD